MNEPYSGKGTATAKFAAPGDYMIHVTANDYSGTGGGGEQCCWTTALVKVTVTAVALAPRRSRPGSRSSR